MDNREKAILLWLIVFAAFVVIRLSSKQSARRSFRNFVDVASHWKIVLVLFLYWCWIAFSLWIAALIEIWDERILTDIVFWLIFSSMPFLFNYDKLKKGRPAWKLFFAELFSAAIVVEVVASLQPFNFFLEVVLIALLVLFSGMTAYARAPEHQSAKKFANVVIVAIVIAMMTNGIIHLITGWSKESFEILVMKLGLGIWLPLALLPFLYIFALVSEYEMFFLRVSNFDKGNRPSLSVRIYAFRIFGLRLKKLGAMSGLLNEFNEVKSISEANEYVDRMLGVARDRINDPKQYAGMNIEDVPEYEVIKINENVGVTALDELIVLTSPIDLKNDDFKNSIKQIFSDIAKMRQSPNFMATIYADREVLDWYESLDRDGSKIIEMLERRNSALIATYVGGFDHISCVPSADDEAYYINWFDGTDITDPVVGKYRGEEQWQP